MSDLAGRSVIVTGGAHGLGRAYCEALVGLGAMVTILDVDGEAAESLAEELGGDAIPVEGDVAVLRDCHRAAQSAIEAFGDIHGLINNAAIYSRIAINRGRFDAIDPDEWDRVMEVNVKGSWQMCLAVVPVMKKAGYGKIVNVSSGTAFKGPMGRCHYVTSKAAILGLTRTLARELGEFGIRVNALAPGSTLSEDDPDDETVQMRERAASRRSLPQVEKPSDVIGTVRFLLSQDSDFLTGQTIVVDGGEYMH